LFFSLRLCKVVVVKDKKEQEKRKTENVCIKTSGAPLERIAQIVIDFDIARASFDEGDDGEHENVFHEIT
jgi:hypothetical protein